MALATGSWGCPATGTHAPVSPRHVFNRRFADWSDADLENPEERQWDPPAPLLFQYDRGGEPSTINCQFIREVLKGVIAFIGLTDAAGRPLDFTPQDFRRMFITDAIRTGLPPHIAQVVAGHANINTVMGYNAIYLCSWPVLRPSGRG
ncbi:tyrosine-type recombinase/integrase [Streptomyces sp. NPDC002917]|uniref:tyrosine-type recombinase/integrase n=1 Tax=Streptomyces sp. NPDC002917 TaxID=3364671 RepID=UPI00368B1CFC